MTDPVEVELFSADIPLSDPKDDAFGYAPFAKHLASALARMTPADGLVVSVYGPWGFGKSTVLNFVLHFLADVAAENRPTIVRFNPWWFTGSEDIARRFFQQLLGAVNRRGLRLREIRRRLAKFAAAIADSPIPYSRMAKLGVHLGPREESLPELREGLEKHLRASELKIIVVIDDVDRLTSDETRQLFRVIKAVANLPHIVYLLAFDKHRVAAALEETYPDSGSSYLEKIVQVPFDLPVPDRASLRRVFVARLNSVLSNVPEAEINSTKWANIFLDGIDQFLASPRAITRLINTLKVTFPAVEGEVDPIEFIALESLRLFTPSVYEAVRSRRTLFVGHATFANEEGRKADRGRVEEIIKSAPSTEQPAVRTVLGYLFPRLAAVFGNTHYGAEWEGRWRRERRVASNDVFDVYFRLSVQPGAISTTEMRSAITILADERSFAELLRKLSSQRDPSGANRARAFLSRLEDYTETVIPEEVISSAVQGLLAAGDDLVRADPNLSGPFDFGMNIQIGRLMFQLLRRLKQSDRLSVLEAAAPTAGVTTFVDETTVFLSQHDPKREAGGNEPLLDKNQADALQQIALARIRTSAADGSLDSVPSLPVVLGCWAHWGAKEEMSSWLATHLKDTAFVASFVAALVQVGHTWGLTDKAARKTSRIDLKWVSFLIEPEELRKRVEVTLRREDLNEDQRSGLELFIDTITGKVKDDIGSPENA